jgi:hypothetical protein
MGIAEREYDFQTPSGDVLNVCAVILCVRTYAIYERSRKIFWSLGVLWVIWVLGNAPVVWIFTDSLACKPDPVLHAQLIILHDSR